MIGSPPAPDAENSENIISTFILELVEPDNPFGTSDAVRILLLQLSCLLVDQGKATKLVAQIAKFSLRCFVIYLPIVRDL